LKILSINIFAFYVSKNQSLKSASINSFDDHRITMTFAIASITNGILIEIDKIDNVKKSYPNFWDEFIKIGGEIN